MNYYPIVKRWSKIKKHLGDKELNKTLVRDFNKFTFGRWNKPFVEGMIPFDFESCDWYCGRKGRRPEYWDYVKHSACHWLVNFNLRLAILSEPTKKWRILTSQKHSTVWDGEETLFDLNFTALQVDPNVAFNLATNEGKELKVGKRSIVFFADHYSIQQKTRQLSYRVNKQIQAYSPT